MSEQGKALISAIWLLVAWFVVFFGLVAPGMGSGCSFQPFRVEIFKSESDPSGYVAMRPDVALERGFDADESLGMVDLYTPGSESGLLTLRSETRYFRMETMRLDPDVDPEQIRAVAAQAFAGTAAAGLPGFNAARLAVSDYRYTQHFALGYLVDAACYLSIGCSIWLLTRIRASALKRAAVQRCIEDGQLCPQCGYELVGLKSNCCPECGRILEFAANMR